MTTTSKTPLIFWRSVIKVGNSRAVTVASIFPEDFDRVKITVRQRTKDFVILKVDKIE